MINWSSFKYLARQGLHSMLANRLMTFASVGVLTVCLILTGIAGLFSANVNSLVSYLGQQNETVVYLKNELSATQAAAVDSAIRSISGISEVNYVSKEQVLETYESYMAEYASLWADFEGEDNPFVANYRIVVSDLTQLEAIKTQLEAIDGVDTVKAPTELSGVFLSVQRVVNYAGWALIAALGIVSVVVINNTIRITVFARRKEINIMKFVGATNGFIRLPFFVEGMSSGLLAGAIASAVVLGCYALISEGTMEAAGFWKTLLGASVVPFARVWYLVLPGFLLFGALIGSLGTASSIRKYLKV